MSPNFKTTASQAPLFTLSSHKRNHAIDYFLLLGLFIYEPGWPRSRPPTTSFKKVPMFMRTGPALGLGDRHLGWPGSYEHSRPVDRDENISIPHDWTVILQPRWQYLALSASFSILKVYHFAAVVLKVTRVEKATTWITIEIGSRGTIFTWFLAPFSSRLTGLKFLVWTHGRAQVKRPLLPAKRVTSTGNPRSSRQSDIRPHRQETRFMNFLYVRLLSAGFLFTNE